MDMEIIKVVNVGEEKKFKQGWKILDDFIYRCIDRKREAKTKAASNTNKDQYFEVGFDLLNYSWIKIEIRKIHL